MDVKRFLAGLHGKRKVLPAVLGKMIPDSFADQHSFEEIAIGFAGKRREAYEYSNDMGTFVLPRLEVHSGPVYDAVHKHRVRYFVLDFTNLGYDKAQEKFTPERIAQAKARLKKFLGEDLAMHGVTLEHPTHIATVRNSIEVLVSERDFRKIESLGTRISHGGHGGPG